LLTTKWVDRPKLKCFLIQGKSKQWLIQLESFQLRCCDLLIALCCQNAENLFDFDIITTRLKRTDNAPGVATFLKFDWGLAFFLDFDLLNGSAGRIG